MSTFGLKYFAECDSKFHNIGWRVEIAERDFSGDAEEMIFSGSSPLKIAWEKKGDSFVEPIKGTEATIEIICNENFKYTNLFTSDPRKFRVTIYRNERLFWRGFISPNLYSETFDRPPYPVTISAMDGFSLLSNIKCRDVDTAISGGKQSLLSLVETCVGYMELDLHLEEWINLYAEGMDTSLGTLEQTYIDVDAFYMLNSDPTYLDLLELCLKPFAAQIFQSNGGLHIRRIVSLYDESRPSSFYSIGMEGDDIDQLVTENDVPINIFTLRPINEDIWSGKVNVLRTAKLNVEPGIKQITVTQMHAQPTDICKRWGLLDIENWEDTNEMLVLTDGIFTYTPPVPHIFHDVVWDGVLLDESKKPMDITLDVMFSSLHDSIIFRYYIVIEDARTATKYYLNSSGEWEESSSRIELEEAINDHDLYRPEIAKIEIKLPSIITTGVLQIGLIPSLSDSHLGFRIFDATITIDEEDDSDEFSDFDNAVVFDSTNSENLEISLACADLPNISNSNMRCALYFTHEDLEPTKYWCSTFNNETATLVDHIINSAYSLSHTQTSTISGTIDSGEHIDMNSTFKDDRYLDKTFYLNYFELDAIMDNYDMELVEMPPINTIATAEFNAAMEIPFDFSIIAQCGDSIVFAGEWVQDGLSGLWTMYIYNAKTNELNEVDSYATVWDAYNGGENYIGITGGSEAVNFNVCDWNGNLSTSLKEFERAEDLSNSVPRDPVLFNGKYWYVRENEYQFLASWVVYCASDFYGFFRDDELTLELSGNPNGSISVITIDSRLICDCSMVWNTNYYAEIYTPQIDEDDFSLRIEGAKVLAIDRNYILYNKGGMFYIADRDSLYTISTIVQVLAEATCAAVTFSQVAYAIDGVVYVWIRATKQTIEISNPDSSADIEALYYLNNVLHAVQDGVIYKLNNE